MERTRVPEPSPQLFARVLTACARAERAAYWRRGATAMLAVAAGAACVPAFRALVMDVSTSGFAQVLGFIAAEPTLAARDALDVALALAEMLPTTALALACAAASMTVAALHALATSAHATRYATP